MGVALTYGELDRLSRNFGVYLQQCFGCAVATAWPSCCPTCCNTRWRCSARCAPAWWWSNVNPLYTARELQHQLADSGAVAIVVLENFAHTLQEVVATTSVRHIISTQVGDLFPPLRRWLVNFAIKRVKRMVPRWQLPARWTSTPRCNAGPAKRSPTLHSPTRTSPSCSTRAAPPAWPRARS